MRYSEAFKYAAAFIDRQEKQQEPERMRQLYRGLLTFAVASKKVNQFVTTELNMKGISKAECGFRLETAYIVGKLLRRQDGVTSDHAMPQAQATARRTEGASRSA